MGVTLGDVIAMVDDIKPNAFSEETKTAWINECEGMVQTRVLLLAQESVLSYEFYRDRDRELIVKPPFHKIYWSYLSAMIDFANGEYNKYQNTMQMFNAAFGEYMRWFADCYSPSDGGAVESGYYIVGEKGDAVYQAVGTAPPLDQRLLWVDTSGGVAVLKYHDGAVWVPVGTA